MLVCSSSGLEGVSCAQLGLASKVLLPSCTVQSSPELQKLFGEDPEAADSMSPFTVPAKPPSRGIGTTIRPIATTTKTSGMETPRGELEELTEEELLKLELEKVKMERKTLVQSILAARDQAGVCLRASALCAHATSCVCELGCITYVLVS